MGCSPLYRWRVYFLDLLIARWFRDTPSIGNLHIYGLLWLGFFPHPPSTGHFQFQHVQRSHDFYGAFLAVMAWLPLKIAGWYGLHGKSQRKMDNLGAPLFQETPIFSSRDANPNPEASRCSCWCNPVSPAWWTRARAWKSAVFAVGPGSTGSLASTCADSAGSTGSAASTGSGSLASLVGSMASGVSALSWVSPLVSTASTANPSTFTSGVASYPSSGARSSGESSGASWCSSTVTCGRRKVSKFNRFHVGIPWGLPTMEISYNGPPPNHPL